MPRKFIEDEPKRRKSSGDTAPELPQHTQPHSLLTLQQSAGNRAVARLVGYQAFKTETTIRRTGRRNLNSIDKQLKLIAEMTSATELTARRDALRKLVVAAFQYERGDHHDERLDAVHNLSVDAERELDMVEFALAARQSNDVKSGMRALFRAQNLFVQLSDRGVPNLSYFLRVLDETSTALMGPVWQHGGAELDELAQEDFQKLSDIAQAPDTPPLLRAIVTEIVANRDQTTLKEGPAGATRTPTGPNAYRVSHGLMMPGGEAERIGSLLHEFTHVSLSESYANTPIIMSFPKDVADHELGGLVERRSNHIAALEQLIGGTPGFSDRQRVDLTSKAQYARGDKLGFYVDNFYRANKITHEERSNVQHWASLPEMRAISSIVIEYDTSVNEMLMWMHLWRIPPDNAVYRKLVEMGQECYDERRIAREANKAGLPEPRHVPPLPPSPPPLVHV